MIFGKNAGLMLKYQKAKAKMVEYDVSKQEYPHFPLRAGVTFDYNCRIL